jgi:phenylpyruvate tautomerase PptA (4-oxalocrotonate tautomerase family)
MPLIKIEIRKGRPAAEKKAMLEAVHQSLVEAFGIPDWDRTQRIVEYAAEDFEIPPGKSDRYSLILITQFPGRSAEAKRTLYQSIVRRFGEIGIPPEDVFIVLMENGLENWGIRGGVPASDVDLGFELKV